TCTSRKTERNCSLRKARRWRTRLGRRRDLYSTVRATKITKLPNCQITKSLTPPPTPAAAAAAKRARPLPAPPARPDTGANRCGHGPPTGPASCPLVAGCAGERGEAGLLRAGRRRDRAACLIQSLSP